MASPQAPVSEVPADGGLQHLAHGLSVALQAAGLVGWCWDLVADRWAPIGGDAQALMRCFGLAGSLAVPVPARTADWLPCVHPDDAASLPAALAAAQGSASGDFLADLRVDVAGQATRWLRLQGRLERHAHGSPWRVLGAVQDITDRQSAEQQRRDDALRLQLMIEQSRDGVVVLGLDGRVGEANAAFAGLLGHPIAALPALRPPDWVAELSLPALQALLNDAAPGPRHGALQLRRRDGALLAIEASFSRGQLGGQAVCFMVCRDLTERGRIETALSASEARFQATFENSAVGFAENALDGRWLNVNPRLCQITGYDRDALMALDYRKLTHPDDLSRDWAQLRQVLDGRLPAVVLEKRYLRRDGQVIWVVRTSSLVRWPDGRPRYYVSVIEDITDRKRIESELAEHREMLEVEVFQRTDELRQAVIARTESEHFLRSVADNLPDMVGYWDAGRVLRFANRAYRTWFERDRDVIGLTRDTLIGDPDDDAGELAFAAALAGRAQRFEYLLRRGQDEQRHVRIHYVPDWQGSHAGLHVAGVFVLVSDITSLKDAELRLQALNEQLVAARDRAEAANRAKSAFLANMSHEIRTPMNAILGLTHLMRRDGTDPLAAGRLAKVSDAAHHLLDVVNDVLDLSKIESGKLTLSRSDFPVASVIDRACALVADGARGKGLQLQRHCDPLPALLHGDPTRLSQALLNLMGNAVKFTDHGRIEVRCTVERSTPEALWLRFAVQDTGIGVPADRLGQLFNNFEQADNSSSRRHGGTGLGLAITRRLALLMDGEVGASSTLGKGSCFWFTGRFERVALLPGAGDLAAGPMPTAGPVAVPDPALDTQHQAALAGATVLLAEDNLVNQEVAAELLRSAGMIVDLASNGAQAVALGRTRAYDLILLDMQMPEVDGLEAARVIRSLPQHRRTPILAMTANAFGDDRQACLAAGMDDHLGKPVQPEQLYAMLAHWRTARRAEQAVRPPGGTGAAATAPAAGPAPALADPPPLAVPGLTMSRALMYLPGRNQVFERVLRQFAGHYRAGLAGLAAALEASDWRTVQRLLHSLRGACGAIGATALLDRAGALEQALQGRAKAGAGAVDSDHAALARECRDLDDALMQLVAAVDAALDGLAPTDTGPAMAVDPATLHPGMDALAGLLRVADYAAGAAFRSLAPSLSAAFGAVPVQAMSDALARHDYDAALLALHGLRHPTAGMGLARPAPHAAGHKR